MGNEKSITELTLADLKGAAEFVDDGVAIETHEHDRSVGMGSGPVDPPTKAIKITGTTEELLAMNATPEGRAKVAAMFGIINREQVDDVIDIPERPEFDALVAATGGPEKLKENAQALREIVAMTGRTYDELIEGLTPSEENAEIVSTLAEWREALSNPRKAAALLDRLWSHVNEEPMKSYVLGRASPEFSEAYTRLHQASCGEPPVGRKKPKGDGHVR